MKSVEKRMKLEYIMVNEVIKTFKEKHPMFILIYEFKVYRYECLYVSI